SELIAALDGRFDDHHAELARLLVGQIDSLTVQIDTLTARIEQLIATMSESDHDSHDHRGSDAAESQATSQAGTGDQPTVPGFGESAEIGVETDAATAIRSPETATAAASTAETCPAGWSPSELPWDTVGPNNG
ncbi:MAG TPA: hypothetical protein VE197_18895, partial [Mycobacterium sp.]|nr:hypothetical protein [Mycobacterium sp.]